jgi:Ni/Fe-hydrogenase subunit HybB-like protein
MQLQEFPFDYQIAQIVLEAAETTDDSVFVTAPSIEEGIQPDGLLVDGWNIDSSGCNHAFNYYPALEQTYDRVAIYYHPAATERLLHQQVWCTPDIELNLHRCIQ